MEQARIEWLDGLAPAIPGYDAGQGPVIVNASCDFLLPLQYHGEVEVSMYVGNPGRTSIGTYCVLDLGGKRYAEGAATAVWIDLQPGRPVAVPPAMTAPPGPPCVREHAR